MAFPSIVFFFVLLFWLVVAAGLVLFAVWVIRSRSLSPGAAAPTREAPLDILARRYAAGEISAGEYKRARDLLTGGGKT